ncbi:putative phenylalanine--tRNA ligase alpha subunit [Dictyocoela muelleri]|nr:putative phenylalanine--tRNA ligase alpha subunit [Dictyocoela muelleri]
MVSESEIISKLKTEEKITLINEENIHGLILHLSSKKILKYIQKNEEYYVLNEEGSIILKHGSPEYNYFYSLGDEKVNNKNDDKQIIKDADKNNYCYYDFINNATLKKIAIGNALKNKWVKIENGVIKKNLEKIEDTLKQKLKDFDSKKELTKDDFRELIRRKVIEKKKRVVYELTKGESFFDRKENLITEITADMIIKDTVNTPENENQISLKLKNYNFNSLGTFPSNGSLHPLLKIREEFRSIFLEMGFKEMNTRKFVESSFWNFDVLFQPQNHPSRDAHDTFFIKNPKFSRLPEEYAREIKNVHENGDYGSLGYGYEWKYEEAMKNILRTHTTAVSARYMKYIGSNNNSQISGKNPLNIDNLNSELKNLKINGHENIKINEPERLKIIEDEKLSENKKPIEIKLFSIDRVFRNEHVDATHLAEFHQIEGLIIGEKLSLKHLLGILTEFFSKLGIKQLKFKPAYNPYTEPSVEVFAFHPSLNKFIEIGNSGIFRPEMTGPMGLNNKVIAWGLSLERPAMIKYGIKNIRDLVGHSVDIESIKKSSICYF